MPATCHLRLFLMLSVGLSIGAVGCSPFARGKINGVDYHMALQRPGVPGGVSSGIKIRMDTATEGTLVVDGVDYGRVRSGDSVRVTQDGVVAVNGEPRVGSLRT